MKKYLILLIIPVLIFIFWDKQESVKSSSLAPTSTSALPPKKTNNKQVFFGKRPKLKVVSATTDSCDEVASLLDERDFMLESEQPLSLVHLEDLSKCLPADFQHKLSDIKATCFAKKIEKDLCLSNLVMLRGILRSKHLVNPETRGDLGDLMMSEFAKKVPDFKKLQALAKKLLADNPNDLPVQKVWAVSSVVASGDPRNVSDHVIQEIYEALDPALMESDPEMRGLDVMLKTKLKPDSVEELTRQNLLKNPKDLASKELLGWSLWQQGRREEALAQVDAILAQKNDPWLRDVRNKLAAPNASKETYPGRINLGVRLEDLWD